MINMPDFGHLSTIFSILLKFAYFDPKMAPKWLIFSASNTFFALKKGLKL